MAQFNTPSNISDDSNCEKDGNCDLPGYVISYVTFILLCTTFFIFCISMIKNCRRRQLNNSRNRSSDQFHTIRQSAQSHGGTRNAGYVEDPPRYEQIFKRDGTNPDVVTTLEVRSSSDVHFIDPPTYEQSSGAIFTISQMVQQQVVGSTNNRENLPHPDPTRFQDSITERRDDSEISGDGPPAYDTINNQNDGVS